MFPQLENVAVGSSFNFVEVSVNTACYSLLYSYISNNIFEILLCHYKDESQNDMSKMYNMLITSYKITNISQDKSFLKLFHKYFLDINNSIF